jgi:hypothetical protein
MIEQIWGGDLRDHPRDATAASFRHQRSEAGADLALQATRRDRVRRHFRAYGLISLSSRGINRRERARLARAMLRVSAVFPPHGINVLSN